MTKNVSDDLYLLFQEGSFLIKGWKRRMEEILWELPADEREKMRPRLTALGERIGKEWAREDPGRKINTPKLKQWGKKLEKSRGKGPKEVSIALAKIEKEVGNV